MARRLLRLWRAHGRLAMEPFLRGGWQATGWVVGETILNIGSIFGVFLLAQRFAGIGRWSQLEVEFMLGFALLARGLVNAFAGYNVLMISRRIGRGQLDHTLLQPQPLWLSLATEGFAPFDLLVTVGIGAALTGWSVVSLPEARGIGWLLLFAINLVAAMTIIVAYQYSWGALAFWAPRGAEEVNSTTSGVSFGLTAFPLDQASPGLVGLLLSVLPVGFIAWIPSRTLLHVAPGVVLGPFLTPLAAAALALVALTIFRRGLRHYEITGSRRYSDFGHRR